MTAVSAAPEGRRVSVLRAHFESRDGMTRLASRYHTSPIKIAKAFQLGAGSGVLVMDVSPGMLDGDRYELDWILGSGCSVQISNQSFLKVHPCRADGGASLVQRFQLGQNAVAEHMPEPMMLFAEASLTASSEVHLADGSVWMQAEVICPGRTLRGEVFRFRRLDNRLAVYDNGELIYRQRQLIEPASQQIAAPGSWHAFTHWGTFCLFGNPAGRELEERIRAALEAVTDMDVRSGVSLTWKSGLVVQAAGFSAWTVQRVLEAAHAEARRAVFKEPPQLLSK
ncbi:urease accessory protein UreD [Paenibacillus pasadenensis]|uniref:urease accessory protein UreD n=1 Tax=Paenibacillus pasadenensis TaxID=217090 RepID=UPI00203DF5A1|nr:urease accessory protein UreD [Paenibacillus pasadenensis]MCM3746619.1 urease accessory protein UreD [Paenibacillus pasadenensis]